MSVGHRIRGFLSGALLALGALAATLLVLEIAVRVWIREDPALVVRDAAVGQRFRPAYEDDVFSNSASRMIHRRFNALGFRGPDRATEKRAGVRRLALLGDSFIASTALDDADTLPAALERALNAHGGVSWEVLGFGVDAYSPAQSLLVWREFAKAFAPDVVVFCFFNGNDVSDGDRRLTNYPRPYFSLTDGGDLELHPVPQLSASFSRVLGDYSRLYVWQKRRVQGLVSRWRAQAEGPPGVLRYLDAEPPPLIEGSWVLAERVIALLAGEVRISGAEFVLVDIPDLVQVRDRDWGAAVAVAGPAAAPHLRRDYPEQRLAAFAEGEGIRFIPLLPPLREAARTEEVYLPDGHWNAAGIRVGAEVILRALKG